ncbi:7494_t:CDS:1 [Acaulospora morrowiae]|uniref:7494_t:CDS:1 n=1 Tax=Acaulospora morrowiae TaxID=94023 RepID=A0A9N8ZK20_9GLOM|nr:7494_t:CDS:1 [Acaulospora morrowiae]
MFRCKLFAKSFCPTIILLDARIIPRDQGFVTHCHSIINNRGAHFSATSRKAYFLRPRKPLQNSLCAKPGYSAYLLAGLSQRYSSEAQPEEHRHAQIQQRTEVEVQHQHEETIHSQFELFDKEKEFALIVKEKKFEEASEFLKQEDCYTNVEDAIKFKRNLHLEGEDFEVADQMIREHIIQSLESRSASPNQILNAISSYNQESFHYYLETSNTPSILKIYEDGSTISPLNALYVMTAYVIKGELETSKEVMNRFDAEGVPFEEFLNSVRTYLSPTEENRLRQVMKHRRSYVESLFKSNRFDDAQRLYDEIIAGEVKPDEFIHYTFLSKFLYNNCYQNATQVWRGMDESGFKPTLEFYNRLIHGFGKKSKHYDAEVIWNKMLKSDIKPDVKTYGTMIDIYFRSNESRKAIKLFQQMTNEKISPNIEIFNTMINGFLMRSKTDEAMKMYRMMPEKGIKPDIVTYNALIQRLMRSHESLAFEILQEMNRSNVKPDVRTLSILLEKFFEMRDIESVQKTLNSFRNDGIEPNLTTYGVIIDGLIKMGNFAKALETYKMISKGRPSVIQIESSMLKLYFKQKNFDAAMQAHKNIISFRRRPTEGYFNILIGGFIKAGYHEIAKEFYDQMSTLGVYPNSNTYKTLIYGYMNMNMKDSSGVSEVINDIKDKNFLVLDPELKELIEMAEKSLRKKKLSTIIR